MHVLCFFSFNASKLCNILFTRELARRLEGTNVTANCLHPGFVKTGFGQEDAWYWKLAVRASMVFARTPEKGAEGIVYLATSPEVDGKSGGYWRDRSERRSSSAANDMEMAAKLWEATDTLVASESATPA